MTIHNRKYLKPYRKSLRNKLTPAEAFLWNYLKAKKLQNRKFRRQHSIQNYIVDFYCPQEKLVIELDGQGHFEPQKLEKDKLRDEELKSMGITVLRFENQFVFNHLNIALDLIQAEFKQ